MKIVISGSIAHIDSIKNCENELQNTGHEVYIPDENGGKLLAKAEYRSAKYFDIKNQMINQHIEQIRESDALLVVNEPKNGVDGYIGANTLMEMCAAMIFQIPIFVLHAPDASQNSYDEIMGMKPRILNGNLNLIKEIA